MTSSFGVSGHFQFGIAVKKTKREPSVAGRVLGGGAKRASKSKGRRPKRLPFEELSPLPRRRTEKEGFEPALTLTAARGTGIYTF